MSTQPGRPRARDMDYDAAARPRYDLQWASKHLGDVLAGAPLTHGERAQVGAIQDLAETAMNLYDGTLERLWTIGAADGHLAEQAEAGTKRPAQAYARPELVAKAFALALDLHNTDTRGPKGAGKPYFAHILAVAATVSTLRDDDTALIVAILHDVAEDHPDDGRTIARIGQEFGAEIAAEVLQLSDPSDVNKVSKTHDEEEWKRRKRAYLAQITFGSDLTHVVKLADALSNISDALVDLRDKGKPSWTSSPKRRWYYLALCEALDARNAAPGYAGLLDIYRRSAGLLDARAPGMLDGGVVAEPPPDDGLARS